MTDSYEKKQITFKDLLADLGPATNRVSDQFSKFAFIPPPILDRLADGALEEYWGERRHVLMKYIALHVRWSLEQNLAVIEGESFYTTAGHLTTRNGAPLYLVFERNSNPGRQPWCLRTCTRSLRVPTSPRAPVLAPSPPLDPTAEPELSHEHMLQDHPERVPFLARTPPVAQISAISGAITWSLRRGLELPHHYYGRVGYLVPLYLTTRENINLAPDLVAPLELTDGKLLVRTVLLPEQAYPNARPLARRADELSPWLLDAWRQPIAAAAAYTDDDVDALAPSA